MSIRSIYVVEFLLVCFLLAVSVYLQVFDGFIPCPLCTLQRLCFGLLGIWFLIACCVYKKYIARCLLNTLSLLTATLGMLLAGRQIWLQHYPTHSNECGASLEYMLGALPFNQVVQKVLVGSAECTQRGWEFFSLSMAEWSLLWFVLFLMLSVYSFCKR